jgi:hypothetical protein
LDNKANSQQSDQLLEALLLWQKDLLPSQTLRNVVRESIRSADRELLERYELSSGDDESFKSICSQLITKLGGNPQQTSLGAEDTHSQLEVEAKTPAQQVQIRKVTPPADQWVHQGAAVSAAANFHNVALHSDHQASMAATPAAASQAVMESEVAGASPSHRKPAELDFEVEFLPDLEEPAETGPVYVFDPIMSFQKVDGMIRFASMDWLSIPRIIALACIAAVASLPFVIESPALDPEATNQYAGPRNVSLGDAEDGESTDVPADKIDGEQEEAERSSGLASQKPGEDETSALDGSATSTDAAADDPYAIFKSDQTVETKEVALEDSEQEEPIDLDSVLAPILGESKDSPKSGEQDDSDSAVMDILSSIEVGDFESAATQLKQLSGEEIELPWLKAEMALRDRTFTSRRDAWLALLVKDETSLTDDLLCARLLLSASPSDRAKLVAAAREQLSSASASKSAARYMRWCLSWSDSRDWATLISQNASKQAERRYVDSIFVAIATFAADDVPTAYKELLDSQVGLQTLQFSTNSEVESWIGAVSVEELTRKVRKTLNSVSGRLTRAPR